MINRTIFTIILLIALSGLLTAATEYDSVQYSVNDKVITKNEIEVKLFELLSLNKIKLDSVKEVSALRKKVVESLIEEALIDIQAEVLMIKVSEDQLDEEVEIFRKQRKMGQAEFEDALERQQVTLTDFRKSFRRQLRRNKVINREVRSKIEISEERLKNNYENNLTKNYHVHARHILLRVDSDAPDDEISSVRNRILSLKKEIESGKSFAEIATIFSEDPSAKRNQGDLGFFRKQDMQKEFSEAAFSLTPGEISNPVRTPLGFHLIEVLEKKEETREPFSKVRGRLYQEEFQKAFVSRYKKYIDRLKKDAQVKRH